MLVADDEYSGGHGTNIRVGGGVAIVVVDAVGGSVGVIVGVEVGLTGE